MMSLLPRLAVCGSLLALVGTGSFGRDAWAEDVTLLPPVVGANEAYAADGRSGAALFGRDPVTYFTQAGPAFGTAEHELVWSGLVWRFVSGANRAAFLRDPTSFLPRIGGYDAASAARGLVVGSDPEIFAILDDRLYLFRSAAGRARFRADRREAAEAERRWPALEAGLVRG